MAKYTLTYFNGKGRAEPIRLAFAIGHIEYKDERIKFEDWGKLKMSGFAKFSSLPVLEFDGKQFAQSRSILRYVGKQTNLYPQNYDEQLIVDEGVDLAEDIRSKVSRAVFEIQDEQEKIEARKKLQDEELPQFIGYYEKQLQIKGTGYYSDKLSIADLFLYTILAWITSGVIDHLSFDLGKYKAVNQLFEKIDAIPEVHAHNAKHNQLRK